MNNKHNSINNNKNNQHTQNYENRKQAKGKTAHFLTEHHQLSVTI